MGSIKKISRQNILDVPIRHGCADVYTVLPRIVSRPSDVNNIIIIMTGPSPKRGLGIVDSIMGLLVGWIVWPVLGRRGESMCRQDGKESRK
ncbi:hypothetical protein F5B19DRAFT_476765 [Rostrohypoxylon terebratum]|nr:hypothetical protein F5B19DRAFT_476765 [Rostrohypoxylon terebratum]